MKLLFSCIFIMALFSGIFFPWILFSQDNASNKKSDTWIFKRVHEPNEDAFNLLIPKDWTTSGGIYRIDPIAGGGSGNAIDAKVDFSVMSDQEGKVMIRFLPDMNYFDMRFSPAGQMGMFPTGSNYNGMMVLPLLSADQFIQNVVIPYTHPGLVNYDIISTRKSPELLDLCKKEDAFLGIPFQYDAAIMEINYSENGITYLEALIAVTQDFGQIGAGLWKNRHTFLVRAPMDEFESWSPVFAVIIGSLSINMQWFFGEIQGQVKRGEISADVLQKLQQMDNEIKQNRAKTNSQINNDMFLNLTGQEEYVNPYTNKIETGSNEWQYRWTNQDNEVIYTDDINYNPNNDQVLNRDDYKLTPIKK